MPPAHAIELFSFAALALLLVPGPAVLYIVTRSVDQGRRAGLISVMGIHTGTMFHVAAAAAGLSAVLVASATAFEVVKLLGAGYLVILGIGKILGRAGEDRGETREPVALRRVYAQGVVVNLLNPKTALFFLAFLPQFVDPARGGATPQIVFFGLLFIAIGLCSDSSYALLAGTLSGRLRSASRTARGRRVLSGCVYVTLGVVALTARHPRRPAAIRG